MLGGIMTATVIGLVGAVFGALTALIGSALSERRQARHEIRRWRRDQRAAAYDAAFRSLTQAASHRHKVRAEGAMLNEAELQEWFNDVVEAQYRLRVLTSHCHRANGGTSFRQAHEQLKATLALLTSGDIAASAEATDTAAELIARCARRDLGSDEDPPVAGPPSLGPSQ